MNKFLLTGILAVAVSAQSFALGYSNEGECLNNNYINEWGKLKLVGNQLSSESGQPVQLRGWSTHGHQWPGYSCFDDKGDFEGMKKFGANIARIAMYVKEGGWVNKDWMKNCIKWTAELGMYCMVDWHVLNPGTPTSYLGDGAEDFFRDIAQYVKSNNYKHVIYEICNEPNENTEGGIYRPALWKDIKDYADKVLPAIAQNDPGAVVVVGTPQWDQALVFPMEDPIKNDYGLQLMYTFHYYACSHEMYLGGMQAAAAALPIFVTEWGTTEHKGQQGLCEKESDMMIDVCNGLNLGGQKISWCNWSFSTEGGESRSLNNANNYNEGSLSNSGKYIVRKLRMGDQNPSKNAESMPYDQPQKIAAHSSSIILMEKYDKGGEGVAYHEYDADWLFQQTGGSCNAGELRMDECVEVSYTDKETKDICNLGYIMEGEWIKFTVDVEEAGYYRIKPYVNAHTSNNVIGISVNGKNAIRDLNDKTNDKIKAVRMKVNGAGDDKGGYSDWDYTYLYSDYDGKQDADYGIYFEKPGIQTIAISFMTEVAGLGPLKLIPEVNTNIENIAKTPEFALYPNPTEGTFTVSYEGTGLLQIIRLNGIMAYEAQIDGETTIDANLSSGIYLVRLISEDNVMVKKLVVK